MFRSFDPDDGLNQLATVNGTAAAITPTAT
jgi:hypothetical protein